MNHKRKRPKNGRAGCLMCKPWKVNGVGKEEKFKASEQRVRQDDGSEATVANSAPNR